jgi:transposase
VPVTTRKHRSYRELQPQLTSLFQQIEEHYNIEVRLCTPYRPNQKGTVENTVKTLKSKLFAHQSEFSSIQELQETIHNIFNILNQQKHHEKKDTINHNNGFTCEVQTDKYHV